MITTCGIVLKGSDCIICMLTKNDEGEYSQSTTKFTLVNDKDTKQLSAFAESVFNLIVPSKLDSITFRDRSRKGEFASGAKTFKMEAAIQMALSMVMPIKFVHYATLSSFFHKNDQLPIDLELSLHKYAINAAKVAWYEMNQV